MQTHSDQLQSGLVECDNAFEFLDHLSAWGPVFRKRSRDSYSLPWLMRTWVFRGQENADWPLVPSALRPTAKLIPPHGMRCDSGTEGQMTAVSPDWTPEEVFLSELRTVQDFYEHADRGGSPLSEDTAQARALKAKWLDDEEWRSHEIQSHKESGLQWPPAELESLFGVAQHYGVPTQLLDWSRNPYAAAYFCLERFISKGCVPTNKNRRIGVWALKESELARAENLHKMGVSISENPGAMFRLITVPTASNPNLHAQQGLFIGRRFRPYFPNEPHGFLPFDSILTAMREDPEYRKLGVSPVIRFTLPATEGPSLLALLKQNGISGATLYPGFQGAKRGYDETVWLDRASGRNGFKVKMLS